MQSFINVILFILSMRISCLTYSSVEYQINRICVSFTRQNIIVKKIQRNFMSSIEFVENVKKINLNPRLKNKTLISGLNCF